MPWRVVDCSETGQPYARSVVTSACGSVVEALIVPALSFFVDFARATLSLTLLTVNSREVAIFDF